MARDYKKIRAWMAAKKLVLEVYKITKQFPKEEIYGLTSQLRRAAVSIMANIAEGSSRQHKKDYLNFLYIAKGSHAETESLLDLSKDLGYLDDQVFTQFNIISDDSASSLYGLIKSVEAEL